MESTTTLLSLLTTPEERNQYLRTLLSTNKCEITFTKVDGSVRVMPCTLDTAYLPAKVITEATTTRKFNPGVLSVWCLDKQEWRSFKTMNVTDITILND